MKHLHILIISLVLLIQAVVTSGQGCRDYKFDTYFARRQTGGIVVGRGRPVPLNTCISTCKKSRACAAVSWDLGVRTCTWHGVGTDGAGNGDVTLDRCCVHMKKRCTPKDGGQPVPGTQRRPGPNEGGNTEGVPFPSPDRKFDIKGNSKDKTGGKNLPQTTRPVLGPFFRQTTTASYPSSTDGGVTSGEDSGGEEQATTRAIEGTTRMEHTTVPSFIRATPIPDTGSCPDPFERLDNSSASGGTTIQGLGDEEACKQQCLADETCLAVDYVRSTSDCVTHQKVVPESLNRANDSCCIHFRKTSCERTCHVHGPVELGADNNNKGNSTNSTESTMMGHIETCDGLCFVQESLSIEVDGLQLLGWTLERGCDVSTDRPSCHVTSETNGVISFATRCLCDGVRCNALPVAALIDMQLYLPLDGDANDLSGRNRDGDVVNVKFDGYGARKGSAAYLDGSGYVILRKLKGFVFGAITAQEGEKRARFTLALWMKREGGQPGDMTIVSTGSKSGPLFISSLLDEGEEMQHIVGSISLQDGGVYVVQAQAPVDEWVFLVLRVAQAQQPVTVIGEAELEVFTADQDQLVDVSADRVELPDGPLQDNNGPMYLGCAPVSETNGDVEDCFVGHIDEVYLFSESLSIGDLQVLQSVAMARDGKTMEG